MSSVSSTQKALAIDALGGPFKVITRRIPVPSAGMVLVRVESIGLNPAEYKLRRWGSPNVKEFPALLGIEGAGMVSQLGDNVEGVKVGDKVLWQARTEPDRSSYQQYTLVPAEYLVKFPQSFSYGEASSFPIGLTTAAFGLALPPPTDFSHGNVHNFQSKGGAGLKPVWEEDAGGYYTNHIKPILVIGGSGTVGQFVIQIAAYMGFYPIITTASLRHADHLKTIGANIVIDRNTPLAPALKLVTEEPLALVFDAVSTPVTQTQVDVVAPGGVLLTISSVPEGLVMGNKRVSYFQGMMAFHREIALDWCPRLEKMLAEGIFKPLRIETLASGLEGIPAGLQRLEEGRVSRLKLVANPQDTPGA